MNPAPPSGTLAVEVRDERMPAADGTELAVRLWRPSRPGRWPVLLMRQPYGRAIASTVTYAHPHWYASHGYAVAVQDVRGRGDSGGRFGGFAQEPSDGSASVAWARGLACGNGRVGCYGFSYQGLTQLLLEPGGPLPDALAPAMAGLDERLHWASEGGAHWWALGLGWALQLAAETVRRRGDGEAWRRIRTSLESGAFLGEGVGLLERHDPTAMGLGWLRRDPAEADGWTVHEPPADLLCRPMLLLGGWQDPHLGGVIDLLERARAAGGDPLLRIGAWTHLRWGGGIDALQLAFFDRHLRDRPGLEDRPAVAVEDLRGGGWRQADAAAAPRLWGLRSDGRAAIDAAEGRLLPEGGGSGLVVLVHDPWRPAPGRGGHLGLDAGVVERADLDARSDVACFSTAPLEQAMDWLGQPLLTLEVAADQPGFDLCAALSVVRGGGRSVQQLSTGVARFRGAACLAPRPRQVRLQPLCARLRRGERLRLSLAAAAWPQIAVNPGTGAAPAGPSGPGHRVITLQFLLGSTTLQLIPWDSAKLAPP